MLTSSRCYDQGFIIVQILHCTQWANGMAVIKWDLCSISLDWHTFNNPDNTRKQDWCTATVYLEMQIPVYTRVGGVSKIARSSQRMFLKAQSIYTSREHRKRWSEEIAESYSFPLNFNGQLWIFCWGASSSSCNMSCFVLSGLEQLVFSLSFTAWPSLPAILIKGTKACGSTKFAENSWKVEIDQASATSTSLEYIPPSVIVSILILQPLRTSRCKASRRHFSTTVTSSSEERFGWYIASHIAYSPEFAVPLIAKLPVTVCAPRPSMLNICGMHLLPSPTMIGEHWSPEAYRVSDNSRAILWVFMSLSKCLKRFSRIVSMMVHASLSKP